MRKEQCDTILLMRENEDEQVAGRDDTVFPLQCTGSQFELSKNHRTILDGRRPFACSKPPQFVCKIRQIVPSAFRFWPWSKIKQCKSLSMYLNNSTQSFLFVYLVAHAFRVEVSSEYRTALFHHLSVTRLRFSYSITTGRCSSLFQQSCFLLRQNFSVKLGRKSI